MKPKLVVPREVAGKDIEDVVDYYPREAGNQAALNFIEFLQRAFDHIGRHPQTGSPRYAHELNLPGLRAWPVKRYPYWIFYVELDDHIDVWRVLNGQRDIPAWLSTENFNPE